MTRKETDLAVAIRVSRAVRAILSDHVESGPRDSAATVRQLREIIDRSDVTEAILRLGLSEPQA